jgi:hypothetical protein
MVARRAIAVSSQVCRLISAEMSLANRVDPFGVLFETPLRGKVMGNRGGQFHCSDTRRVKGRSYASRQWICCRLSFKGRKRSVWTKGYTELFFSDDVAALAAGHRPCFECRRVDALAFSTAWGLSQGTPPPRAPEMDHALHQERNLSGNMSGHILHLVDCSALPNGAMVVYDGDAHTVWRGQLLRWSFQGYETRGISIPFGKILVITPPSIIGCLRAGYQPLWFL